MLPSLPWLSPSPPEMETNCWLDMPWSPTHHPSVSALGRPLLGNLARINVTGWEKQTTMHVDRHEACHISCGTLAEVGRNHKKKGNSRAGHQRRCIYRRLWPVGVWDRPAVISSGGLPAHRAGIMWRRSEAIEVFKMAVKASSGFSLTPS